MRDARDQGFGLARTRPGDDRDRGLLRLHRGLLCGVEHVSRRGGRFRLRRGGGFCERMLLGRLFCGRGRSEQRKLAGELLDLRRGEQGDRAVFAVKARAALYLARAQAADALGHARPGDRPNVRNGCLPQDGELVPQLGEHFFIQLGCLFRRGRHARGGRDRLGQGREALKRLGVCRAEARRPVGQLLHAVLHADGQLFAAHRAQAAARGGFGRGQAHAAVPVAVQMVLALLGEKLDCAGKALPGADRAHKRGVIALALDEIRLAAELSRRVRVRVRDQCQPIQRGHAPVHRRVGGQAGLDRVDVRGQVVKAVLHRIKARERAKHGKMRRPDVRGDELRIPAGIQRQLEQVAAVQPEDGAAVRPDVADCLEPRGELVRRLEAGQEDHVMYLARLAVALIDRADLARDYKARPIPRRGVRQAVLFFECVYALPHGFELLV